MKHCIVGDVHGEYEALLNLVEKTSLKSKLIFVGDLVDKGYKSAEVVRYIRTHNLACVQGNHEAMMIEHGSKFIRDIKKNKAIDQNNMWLKNGGIETLLSYGLISLYGDQIVPHRFIKEFIFQFEEDITWLKTLPLYLELDDAVHHSGRKVVVSHSSIASVWKLRNKRRHKKAFSKKVLWGRERPVDESSIFNVFGHTPRKHTAEVEAYYANVDTGCYIKRREGYGVLSAYCVESGEVYSSGELVVEAMAA